MVLIERPALAANSASTAPSNPAPVSMRRKVTKSRTIAEATLLANTFEQVDSFLAGAPCAHDLGDDAQATLAAPGHLDAPLYPSTYDQDESRSHWYGNRRTTWMIGLAAVGGVLAVIALAQFLAPKWIISTATDDVLPSIPPTAWSFAPADETPTLVDETPIPPVEPIEARSTTEQVRKPIVEDPIVMESDGPEGPGSVDSEPALLAEGDVRPEQPNRIPVDASSFDEPAQRDNVRIVVSGDAPHRDARNRVGQAIESLQVPEITLGAFGRLMERMADLPMTIEPDALAMARIDLSHPMSIDVREHTVGEALAKGLRPLNLGYQLSGSHVMIQHRAVIENRPASLRLDVRDLLGPHTTASAIAALLTDCGVVRNDNKSDASPLQTESTAIVVQAPPLVQFRVLRFLEQLRLANGLPTRTVYGRQFQASRSHSQRGSEILRQAIVPQWPRRATLSEIVETLHDQTQAHFLIDWPALETAGISYLSRFEITGQPGSLREFLRSFEQVGMRFHAVDDVTIRVTSRTGDWQSREIAFHPVGPIAAATGVSPRQLAESLESAFAESMVREGTEWSSVESRFIYDPGSEHLIVSLPASLHARFERGLERLREASKLAKSTFPNGRWRS